MKNICEVLKYSWKHKIPELRSALTYWENDIPSRIDLGKDKYGGPFTYEEVENVKSFFRLLLLILSLFGFSVIRRRLFIDPLYNEKSWVSICYTILVTDK